MKYLFVLFVAILIFPACSQQEPAVDIWTACAAGNTVVIEAHARFGTDLNAREPQGGSTPLIVASLFGQSASVEALLNAGVDVNSQNNEGSTALHTAAFFCHKDVVELLLENGADTELRNGYGRTPLESVAADWSPEVEGLYQMIGQALQIPVDMGRMKETRPQIATLIQQHDA